ncbi:pyridoxamine 5'-phosphate oxidase family protein [Paracraurococcus lichenis]|uniref:Pyridoxamine 5'-phosphate oxidase family protein n=1 Tax=Paracraurococcus lichenis TaxID=3064888 RepID=A0ABT9DWA0_9PROT|nr:pyridoxamine 5'-phosphate oxidase family protein [Paracraurococcus sp. LOR1-02]MDO9708177.1 pyridoxamine 5'-phosphate oxidase family protein [Paracraurococcus sp. LOR1-02]
MVETRSDAEAKRKVWEMIKDVDIAMMVTMDDEGRFRGRPMRASQKEFDGVLWFFTPAGSPKTGEVAEDERCLLAYSDPRSQNYVSIYGTAELVRDVAQQKKLWSEPLRVWFPGGPEDSSVALLKVTCEGAEYWDSPSSTLVHAYGYLKAVTTGEPPHPGANDKVDFTKKAG